jgi:ubiquinone/menaquinone biosynthesis C-methylase UbiE
MKKHEHSGAARKHFENPSQILLDAGLKPGDVFLDVGTGLGYMAVAAAEIVGSASKVYAIDIYEQSKAALNKEILDKDIKNLVTINADAVKEIPIARNTVDVCLMSNVIHGFAANNELDTVMKSINRVLNEEGKIIAIDFKKIDTGFGPPLNIRLSKEDVDEKLAPYGYKLEKDFDAGSDHYCLVFQRVSLQDKFC